MNNDCSTPTKTENGSQNKKPTIRIASRTPFSTVPLNYSRLDNTLSQTLDLDSLFGHMTYSTFKKAYKSNIQVDINNSPQRVFSHDNVIKTNYKFNLENDTPKSIKKLPHCRLGTSLSTEFGSLDIYLVLLNSNLPAQELKSIVYSEMKKSIQNLGQQASSFFFTKISEIKATSDQELNSEEIKCIVSCHDFIKALEFLFIQRFIDNDPVIFFETFGNKRSTITNNIDIDTLKLKIFSTFDRKYEKYIFVDVCLSVSYGTGTVTVARPKFFDQVKTRPNYSPLFSDTVLNCHRTINNSNTKAVKKGIGIFKHCFKLNFYSTFKYYLDFDKSLNYQFPLSLNSFLTDIYGHKVYATPKKFLNLTSAYESVEKASINDITGGTCFYRCELRANLKKINRIISKLKKTLTVDNFGYFNSRDFFKVIQINLNNFIKLIKGKSLEKTDNDFDSKVFSIIAEYIMKTLYTAGSKPTSTFSNVINNIIVENISRFHDSIGVLTNIHIVVDQAFSTLNTNDKCELLKTQVLYAKGLNVIKKTLLNQVLMASFNILPLNINNCIKWMIETYLIEKHNNLTYYFSDIETPVDHQNQIYIITALKKIFIASPDSKRSSIAKFFFTFFKLKNSISSDNEALSIIANFMKDNGIVSIYKHKLPGRNDMLKINYTKIERLVPQVQPVNTIDKDHLLTQFKATGAYEGSKIKKVKDDEIIRYINAMYKYTDSNKRVLNVLTKLCLFYLSCKKLTLGKEQTAEPSYLYSQV